MKRFNDIVQWLTIIGFLMVISAIPFGWSAYQRIGCYILGIGYLVYVFSSCFWKSWRWDPNKWIYVIMLALWAILPIRQLFDDMPPTPYYLHNLHIQEWFLYMGIGGIIGFPDKLRLWHVSATMILTSLFVIAYCLFLFCFTGEYSDTTPLFRFNYLRLMHVNTHMVVNLYFNMALILGFCTMRCWRQWWQKSLWIIAMVVIFASVLLSDGRIGMLTSLIIVIASVIYYIANKNIRWAVAIGICMALIAGIVGVITPSIRKIDLDSEPRVVAWDFSVRMAEEKPICGYGLSTLSEEYVQRAYQDSAMYFGFVEKAIHPVPAFTMQGMTMDTHHPHNAFLMYWLAYGIVGVLLLLALFVLAAMLPVEKKSRFFLYLFLLALFLQALTEPIGYHFRPQFIAMMLFVWEKTNPSLSQSRTECA